MFGIFDIDTYNIGTSQGLRCSGHLRCSNFARKSNFAKLTMFDFKRTIAKKAELRKIPRPSQSSNLRKGVFAPFGLPKPLPLGEVAPKVTERASPARKSRCEAMGRLFVRAMLSLCQSCLSASLPSQSHFARQLPQRGSPWQAGPLPTGRPRSDMAQKGGPCYRGQQLLDNAPCQAAAGLDSGALLFPGHRALLVQAKAVRHASGSPSGGAVTEGD